MLSHVTLLDSDSPHLKDNGQERRCKVNGMFIENNKVPVKIEAKYKGLTLIACLCVSKRCVDSVEVTLLWRKLFFGLDLF